MDSADSSYENEKKPCDRFGYGGILAVIKLVIDSC